MLALVISYSYMLDASDASDAALHTYSYYANYAGIIHSDLAF